MGSLAFFIYLILPAALCSWVDSTSIRIDYHGYLLGGKGGRCVGLTTLPSPCAVCLQILGASTSWIPQGLSSPVQGWLYLLTFTQLLCVQNVLAPRNIEFVKTVYRTIQSLSYDSLTKHRSISYTPLTKKYVLKYTGCPKRKGQYSGRS
jgi:hypothetical protein